jgi:hypothetical protein
LQAIEIIVIPWKEKMYNRTRSLLSDLCNSKKNNGQRFLTKKLTLLKNIALRQVCCELMRFANLLLFPFSGSYLFRIDGKLAISAHYAIKIFSGFNRLPDPTTNIPHVPRKYLPQGKRREFQNCE